MASYNHDATTISLTGSSSCRLATRPRHHDNSARLLEEGRLLAA